MIRARYARSAPTDATLAYTVKEAAEVLRLGEDSVLKEIREQRIKTIHCGRRVLVPRVELQRWITEKLAAEQVQA